MASLTFLLIFGLIPSLFAQCTVENAEPSFKRSVYEFSTNLLTRISQEKDNHFITSTLSAWTLLATISLGATDTTLAELKQVLKLQNNKCFNNNFLKIATSITSDKNSEVVVERTSNIFTDDKLEILSKFKSRISNSGIGKFESISFTNADVAAQIINEYVSRTTHEIITEIVSSGDLDNVLMVIIDAIYFKGSWRVPFPHEATEVSPFYNHRGEQIGNVNLMYSSDSYKVKSIKNIQARVLELPYGSDERYSMLIFLPFDGVHLNTVIGNMKLISLSTINKLFEFSGAGQVAVQLPRFKITSDLNNLKELLMDMGLKSMFDSSEARFPNISDFPLYVTNFIQKADVEVTEEGTVASAATDADFGFRSLPDSFDANKPFLFMIIDKKVDVPIFTGAYSKPTLF